MTGHHAIGGMTLIVTRGTGTWGPRMRFPAPGEISLVTLRTRSGKIGSMLMKYSVLTITILANLVAVLCLFNPWSAVWANRAVVFLVFEVTFMVLIGIPLFIHHLRKGMGPGQALSASLDSVMNFLSSWV